jgi:polyribonucleotide nucleotidyltransferase
MMSLFDVRVFQAVRLSKMIVRLLVVLAVISVTVTAYRGVFRARYGVAKRLSGEVTRLSMGRVGTALAMAEEGGASEGAIPKQGDDIAKYSVGQTLNGDLVSSKDFGIFVQIDSSKTRVLLPRSLLSRGEYAKLTSMVKSKAKISFEIASVDIEKKTLSGKYNSGVEKKDISTITDDDIKKTEYKATVVGTHDFGIFVELDGYVLFVCLSSP